MFPQAEMWNTLTDNGAAVKARLVTREITQHVREKLLAISQVVGVVEGRDKVVV